MKNLILLIILLPFALPAQTVTMTMDECMVYAVEHSYKTTRQATQAANDKIDYQKAVLQHLPSIGAGISANTAFGRGLDPETNNYINTSTFSNGVDLSTSMPIFNGLRLLNQTRSAKVAQIRGEVELQRVKDEVAEETMIAYAVVIYNSELVQLYDKRIGNYQIQEKRTNRMCELGNGSKADLAQIRATLSSEEYKAINARNNYEISMIRLKDCMNFPLKDTLKILKNIEKEEHQIQSIGEIINYATASNPSAIIGNQTLKMEKLSLSIARGAYYPSISFGAGVSTSYFKRFDSGTFDSYGLQFKNNLGEWLAVSMSIPIFDGLQRRKAVVKAKNNYKQAKSNYNQTLRIIESEVLQAVMELNATESQWQQAQQSLKFQKLANEAAKGRYKQGTLGIIELQTSDNDLFHSEIELRNSYLSYQLKIREVNYYKGIPYID